MTRLEDLPPEFAEAGPPEGFRPFAHYDPAGDCVEFHLSNEPYYGQRLDGWVTLYYSEQTNEVVGGLIKGLKNNLLRRFPGLRIKIEGNRVSIHCLLLAPAFGEGDELKQKTYQAVIEKAEKQELIADLCPA